MHIPTNICLENLPGLKKLLSTAHGSFVHAITEIIESKITIKQMLKKVFKMSLCLFLYTFYYFCHIISLIASNYVTKLAQIMLSRERRMIKFEKKTDEDIIYEVKGIVN